MDQLRTRSNTGHQAVLNGHLRDYQKTAIEKIYGEWEKGRKRTLLVLPTGCGKTVVFSEIAAMEARRAKRVLILVHREELLQQAKDKVKKFTGMEVAIERAEERAQDSHLPVVVASVQSLSQENRLKGYHADTFDLLIIDEAHHATASTYMRIVEHFHSARLLGVTATADRADGEGLARVFDSIAYDYPLREAVKAGYLSRIEALSLPVSIDLNAVKKTAGDFEVNGLSHAIEPYFEEIAHLMQKHCKGRKTVVFLPLIETSQRFCRVLRKYGFHALEVNGQSLDRAEVIQAFTEGRAEVLCNAALLTEGWDAPIVDCIIVLRPTMSRGLYAQMIGRGTRICEGKKSLLLLDFLWMSDKHALCHPASLLGATPAVESQLTAMIEQEEEPQDLFDREEEAERNVAEERERKLIEELEKRKKARSRLIDPLSYAASAQSAALFDYVPQFGWEKEQATEEQQEELENRGINPEGLDQGTAAKLLTLLQEREDQGYASPKQIRFLEKYGFRHVANWKHEEATYMTRRIIANGWNLAGTGIHAATYVPESRRT